MTIDGVTFDSKREADYYTSLKLMKKAGEVIDFELQPVFELQPSFVCGKEKVRAITYRADFLVYYDGYTEIVDVKGYATEVFKLKWKVLKYKYGQDGAYKFTII